MLISILSSSTLWQSHFNYFNASLSKKGLRIYTYLSPSYKKKGGYSRKSVLQVTYQYSVQFSSVAQLCLTFCDPHGLQHSRPPCPTTTPGVYPNSCPLSQWCHLTISTSAVPFSSYAQSFPESGSFHMSQFFVSGDQNTGVSASTSVLPMNTQNWPSLGWTGWISLQAKELSSVFSKITVQKQKFFLAQLYL